MLIKCNALHADISPVIEFLYCNNVHKSAIDNGSIEWTYGKRQCSYHYVTTERSCCWDRRSYWIEHLWLAKR